MQTRQGQGETRFAVVLVAITVLAVGHARGQYSVVPSLDGTKEQFLAKPIHRRVAKAVVTPVEWIVNVAAHPFVRSSVGSLYISNVSLYVKDRTTGKTHRYSPVENGCWSPDSRRIACSGQKRRDERIPLAIIDTEAGSERSFHNRAAPPNWSIQDLSWSADGAMIFFRQEYTVYVFDLGKRAFAIVSKQHKGDTVDTAKLGVDWRAKAERAAPADAKTRR